MLISALASAFSATKFGHLRTANRSRLQPPSAPPPGASDTWTWTGICAQSKLIVSWIVGGRDSDYAIEFMDDLRSRLANRVQLTSDGHKAYLEAVEGAFGADVDYAQLVKIYGNPPEAEKRYSPAECIGAVKTRIEGNPDPAHVSTSYVERQNLTMRMSMRRFTRLTNAHSKQLENHCHALALYFTWYNWVRINSAVRMSPAMAAKLTKNLWDWTDLVKMIDAYEPAERKFKLRQCHQPTSLPIPLKT